tara:strand:+ start:274 stop:633 length:360 start_codon:yes stop_codon:yes gene_type:complete
MAMRIQNGPVVNGAWTNSIAISPNGSDWEHINKDSIAKVHKVFMLTNNESKKWNKNRDQRAQVHIMGNDGRLIFSFDTQDIDNQLTWFPSSVVTATGTGTAANFQAGLATAVEDIMSWL